MKGYMRERSGGWELRIYAGRDPAQAVPQSHGARRQARGEPCLRHEPAAPSPPNPRESAAEQVLRRMPAEQLAAELQRRGWDVQP